MGNPIGIDGPAIRHLDLLDDKFPEFGELFILLCAFIEGYDITTNWEPKGSPDQGFIKEDVEIGDLQWDPLEWYPEDPVAKISLELRNFRMVVLPCLPLLVLLLRSFLMVKRSFAI